MTTDWVWVPFEVDRRFEGFRVDRFLAQRLAAYSRTRVQSILSESRVMRGQAALKPSARVRAGDRILIAYPRRPEPPLPADAALDILYEDSALVIVNKPSGLLSHPTDKIQRHTVVGVLRHARPDLRDLYLLHRLDRETSGVLTLAKARLSARRWTELMEARKIRKEYLALVRGVPKPKRGRLDWPIGREGGAIKVRQAVNLSGAVAATTRYEVLAAFKNTAFIRARPETGRLHQIRVHMAALGHPVLGDLLYTEDGALYLKRNQGLLADEDRALVGFGRLALHAHTIRFPHPVSAKSLKVTAPLPDDIAEYLRIRGIDTLTFR